MKITHTVTGDRAIAAIEHMKRRGKFRLHGKRWFCVGYEEIIEHCGSDRISRAIRNEDLRITNTAAYHEEIELAKIRARYVRKATLDLVLMA